MLPCTLLIKIKATDETLLPKVETRLAVDSEHESSSTLDRHLLSCIDFEASWDGRSGKPFQVLSIPHLKP